MVEQGDRKAWVKGIVARRCNGNAAAFGRKIGKDSSYVSRMLASGTKQARGVSDEVIATILTAFPGEQPPAGWRELPTGNHVSQDAALLRLRQMVVSLALALLTKTNIQDAAAEFRLNVLAAATIPGKLEALESLLALLLQHMPGTPNALPGPSHAVVPPARHKPR